MKVSNEISPRVLFPLLSKYKREAFEQSCSTLVTTPQSPVLIPLQASMPCFKLSDGITTGANASELGPDTHLLVTGSVDDAMEVAEGLLKLFNSQVALTGIQPQLPEYILVLSSSAKAVQTKSLPELLQEASPYRGSAKFFDELKLEDPNKSVDNKLGNQFQYPRNSEIAWTRARQDFFAQRYDDSESVLNSLIQAKSQQPLVYYFRGLLRYNRGDSVARKSILPKGQSLNRPKATRLRTLNSWNAFRVPQGKPSNDIVLVTRIEIIWECLQNFPVQRRTRIVSSSPLSNTTCNSGNRIAASRHLRGESSPKVLGTQRLATP